MKTKMKDYPEFWLIIYLLLGMGLMVVVVLYIVSIFSYRHDFIDGKLYTALHIQLPGYTTFYKPADTIKLSEWVGSGITGIKAEVNGEENPEIEASMMLKAIGWADSTYHLEQRGEHYVLISPEKSWKEWGWTAFYRIGKWKLVKKDEY